MVKVERVRFQVLDIVPHSPHPVTGELISVHERLERVVEIAVLAERVGFDSYAVGERHAGEFVSSSPTVLLGALAQATSRILLSTGVTVLSLLDPVRVAEDYATIDQLSGGRLEIVIGKGNEDKHFPMFGLQLEKQYEYFVENYELLRRLLGVTPELGKALKLDPKWVVNAIKAVGNYGEMFERNLGRNSPLGLPRGLNEQWTKGGLIYALPMR